MGFNEILFLEVWAQWGIPGNNELSGQKECWEYFDNEGEGSFLFVQWVCDLKGAEDTDSCYLHHFLHCFSSSGGRFLHLLAEEDHLWICFSSSRVCVGQGVPWLAHVCTRASSCWALPSPPDSRNASRISNPNPRYCRSAEKETTGNK